MPPSETREPITLRVRIEHMDPHGEAIGFWRGRTVGVRYGAPGDVGLIRVEEVAGGIIHGTIEGLETTSPHATVPRCRHFGRCGGCQWQHLEYHAQLEQKAAMVARALRDYGVVARRTEPVQIWGEPWGYRTRVDLEAGVRGTEAVVGLPAWGNAYVVKVQTCAILHPKVEAALEGIRAVWPVFEPVVGPGSPDMGVLRRIVIRAGIGTANLAVGLVTRRALPLDRRQEIIDALTEHVPGVTSIMEGRLPASSSHPNPVGESLLWGRTGFDDELAGVSLTVPLFQEFPVNAYAATGLIDLVRLELEAGLEDAVFVPWAGIGAYALPISQISGTVIATTAPRDLLLARDNVRFNGVPNCVFYTRDPLRALGKAMRFAAIRHAFLNPPPEGLPSGFAHALHSAGVQRLVYLHHTLETACRDAAAIRQAGYEIDGVQPVDHEPQTSRVSVVVIATAPGYRPAPTRHLRLVQ